MENEKEIESLINAFVEYRNLLSPIEENLRNFAKAGWKSAARRVILRCHEWNSTGRKKS